MSGNEERWWAQAYQPLAAWYCGSRRILPWRQSPTPYETWISEIMLQQTRVEAVKGYYSRFIQALPDIPALAAADESKLMKLWEGLGYYSRARNLQKAARQIMTLYNGALPADYLQLLSLSGIGPYTAGAIASIAFGLPVPAVDGNVLRVYSRCRNDRGDISLPQTRERVTRILTGALSLLPAGASGDFNQALMELGATVCVPNGPPCCCQCPLTNACEGRQAGTMLALPVKTPKKPRRIEELSILILVRDGRFALRKRKKGGLLGGLWELPNVPGHLEGSAAAQAVRELGAEPLRIEPLGQAKHIFTHVEWHMQGFRVTVEKESGMGLSWVSLEGMEDYTLPRAFRYFLPDERFSWDIL